MGILFRLIPSTLIFSITDVACFASYNKKSVSFETLFLYVNFSIPESLFGEEDSNAVPFIHFIRLLSVTLPVNAYATAVNSVFVD